MDQPNMLKKLEELMKDELMVRMVERAKKEVCEVGTKAFTEDGTCDPLDEPAWAFQKWLNEMKWDGAPEVVLDAGCGDGDFIVRALVPKLPEGSVVLGIDNCPETVSKATAKHGDPPRLAFALADIESKEQTTNLLHIDPGYSAGFPKVISMYAMHTILDLEGSLENLRRLLRPKGQALLAFASNGTFHSAFGDLRSSERWREYFQGSVTRISNIPGKDTEAELKEMFSTVGFEIVRCQVHYSYTYYEQDWVKKAAPVLKHPEIERVPEHLRKDFLDDCVRIFKNAGVLKPYDQGYRMLNPFIACILRKTKR